MNKTFRILGVLALVAWTVLGLIGWSKVGDGVHVTLAESAQPPSPDAALLADRFEVLDGDVDALVAAIGENFELLAGAMESGGTSTATQLARAEARLAALEAALPAALEARESAAALKAALARAERVASEMERLMAPGVAASVAAAGVHAPADPRMDPRMDPVIAAPSGEGTPEVVPIEVAAPIAQPATPTMAAAGAVEPEPEAEPAESEASRSFLSFKLPSRDFAFVGEQTFEVLADLSRVGFDATSTLHDFTGVSNEVAGQFTVDLAHADKGIQGKITVTSASLDTGLEGRDEAMWEHLGTETYRTLDFVPTGFETSAVDASRSTLSGRLSGRMTIHGATRDVTMDVSASVDDARRLVVEGEMPLDLTDFDVAVPRKLGLISVDDEVRVWIRLRLRARKGGSKS